MIAVFGGFGLGLLIDRWFVFTWPWAMGAGFFLGVVAGFWYVWRHMDRWRLKPSTPNAGLASAGGSS